MNFDINFIRSMCHSPVYNYVIPGLNSYLVGGVPGAGGCVRLFECVRNHQETITPHSHRFDFQAHVLAGEVINRIWRLDTKGDMYQKSNLFYDGKIGKYKHVLNSEKADLWRYDDHVYLQGDSYGMMHDEIHSIFFKRGTLVLMFEGPQRSDQSAVLEPLVRGKVIDTLITQPWMFLKD